MVAFSEGSGRRMRRFLQEADARFKNFGTLTVGAEWSRDPEDFRRAVDRWLVMAMRELRREHVKHGESSSDAAIFWFVEFQLRGAPHLHIFYTRWMSWSELAKGWSRLCQRFGLCGPEEVNHWKTSTKFERIRGGYRGMIRYASKYAVKAWQKEVPEDEIYPWKGRFWGCRGNRNRGSCHINIIGRSKAAVYFRQLEKLLMDLNERGFVRRWNWERGEGAVYTPIGFAEWSETPWVVEIEILLAKMYLSVERENAEEVLLQAEQVDA